MRTFLAVYRTGSFTAAAKALAITRPTVTDHIGALERQLGRELFVRNAAGTTAAPHAHEMAAAFGDQLDHIDRFFLDEVEAGEAVPVLHVGGPAEFTTCCLIPALADVRHRLPALEMVFDVAGELITQLVAGRLDLIISTVRPREQGVTAWAVADEEFWLVCSPRLAPAERDAIPTLPIVTYHRSLPIVRRYWTTIFGEQPDLEPALVLPNLLAVEAAVVHGYGMSVLPTISRTAASPPGNWCGWTARMRCHR